MTDGIKEVANLMEYFLSGGIRTKSANILKNAGRIIDNMNKKITIYELLGLIKDNKTDGDTYIKYYDRTFENEETSYVSLNCIIDLLFSGKVMLNDKVEILVEILEEDKDIKELKIDVNIGGKYITNEHGANCYIRSHDEMIISKLNEVIREVNKLRKENR